MNRETGDTLGSFSSGLSSAHVPLGVQRSTRLAKEKPGFQRKVSKGATASTQFEESWTCVTDLRGLAGPVEIWIRSTKWNDSCCLN